jgi:hypothetical protein
VAGFVVLFLIIITFLRAINKTAGYNLAQQQVFQSAANAGDHVLASLEYRTLMASTIVPSMADAAGTIIKDETQIDSLWKLPKAFYRPQE